jgi:hypothetical protein
MDLIQASALMRKKRQMRAAAIMLKIASGLISSDSGVDEEAASYFDQNEMYGTNTPATAEPTAKLL